MVLAVVVLLAALVVGRLAGGRWARLGDLPVRRRRLAVLALAAQLGGTVVGGPAYAVGLGGSAALAVAFLVANRGLRGTGLLALGLLVNALVVGANAAMPVSADAAVRAGVAVDDLAADPRHEPVSAGTRLRLLGDVVPVPLPGLPSVVSVGDVLVAAGLGQLVVAGMLRPRALPPLPRYGRGALPRYGRGRQRGALPPPSPVSAGPPAPARLSRARAPAAAPPRASRP